ncbi:unnamed protein product [Sympodiomycopsis kandeliae]
MSMTAEEDSLPSSRLGTQEYWDTVYEREVRNFSNDGDRGEIWFGQESAQIMLEYLYDHYGTSDQEPLILDVGSGNGHLLFRLCNIADEDDDEDDDENEFVSITPSSHMCGIDYSPSSIQLCQDIVREQSQSQEEDASLDVRNIHLKQCDVLDSVQVDDINSLSSSIRKQGSIGWDIVLDKGTLDAIALTPTSTGDGDMTPLQRYIQSLEQLTRSGGLFLITSCNFTSQELIDKVTKGGKFTHTETLPPKRQFQFGGVKGSTTVCVAFHRV